jgi:hypothetical protein
MKGIAMKHCILVKFTDTVTDKGALCAEVERFWADTLPALPGIRGVKCLRNVIDRANRYDLLIRLDMEQSALAGYDASAQHAQWKEKYGPYLAQKAIFDYEE